MTRFLILLSLVAVVAGCGYNYATKPHARLSEDDTASGEQKLVKPQLAELSEIDPILSESAKIIRTRLAEASVHEDALVTAIHKLPTDVEMPGTEAFDRLGAIADVADDAYHGILDENTVSDFDKTRTWSKLLGQLCLKKNFDAVRMQNGEPDWHPVQIVSEDMSQCEKAVAPGMQDLLKALGENSARAVRLMEETRYAFAISTKAKDLLLALKVQQVSGEVPDKVHFVFKKPKPFVEQRLRAQDHR